MQKDDYTTDGIKIKSDTCKDKAYKQLQKQAFLISGLRKNFIKTPLGKYIFIGYYGTHIYNRRFLQFN